MLGRRLLVIGAGLLAELLGLLDSVAASVWHPSSAAITTDYLESNAVMVIPPVDVVSDAISLCFKAIVTFPFKRSHSYVLSAVHARAWAYVGCVCLRTRLGARRAGFRDGALFQAGRQSFLVAFACGFPRWAIRKPLLTCRSMRRSSAQPAAEVNRNPRRRVEVAHRPLRGSTPT